MAEERINSVRDAFDQLALACNVVSTVNDWDLTPAVKEVISQLSPETMKRYYGSGLVIPEHTEGKRILDVGCGSGSLVFILSKLVGETGSVVGIDLSPNLITEAKKQEEYHREKWGYGKKNTEFFVRNAEDLSLFEDQSFDIVVSNGLFCVVPDKDKAFSEVFRVLKNCGEFYLNDVYGSMEVPEEMKNDIMLWDVGLLGAQLIDEFHSTASKAGYTAPHLTCVGPVKVGDDYKDILPGRRYCTAGNRMFRLDAVKTRGPASVTYKGNVKGQESEFKWDVSLTFKCGQPVAVDASLATILSNTRYTDIFDIEDVVGSPSTERTYDYWDSKIDLETGPYGATAVAQNPFTYLDQLCSQGTVLPEIFTVHKLS